VVWEGCSGPPARASAPPHRLANYHQALSRSVIDAAADLPTTSRSSSRCARAGCRACSTPWRRAGAAAACACGGALTRPAGTRVPRGCSCRKPREPLRELRQPLRACLLRPAHALTSRRIDGAHATGASGGRSGAVRAVLAQGRGAGSLTPTGDATVGVRDGCGQS
jgi:hypothetical protein